MELIASVESDTVRPLGDFDPFFHANFERVARSAAFIAGDAGTGQDLAQEAFTRLVERWPEMRSADHARNFAYRVDADGSSRPTVLDGHWESVSWSPDGRRLVLVGSPTPRVRRSTSTRAPRRLAPRTTHQQRVDRTLAVVVA